MCGRSRGGWGASTMAAMEEWRFVRMVLECSVVMPLRKVCCLPLQLVEASEVFVLEVSEAFWAKWDA